MDATSSIGIYLTADTWLRFAVSRALGMLATVGDEAVLFGGLSGLAEFKALDDTWVWNPSSGDSCYSTGDSCHVIGIMLFSRYIVYSDRY